MPINLAPRETLEYQMEEGTGKLLHVKCHAVLPISKRRNMWTGMKFYLIVVLRSETALLKLNIN